MPGNHGVQWWWRPFIPFAKGAISAKYRRYFGDDLTPTLTAPGAVIAGALTAHGVAWASLTTTLRDIAVKGHLPKRDMERGQQVCPAAPGDAAHVLVWHRNGTRADI